MSRIAACLIVKDDSELDKLRNSLNSFAKYVDHIFITGTKEPQEKIKELCKEYGATWSWFEWCKDFSKARNFNFSQVTKEYDWIFWCDTDDVVVGAENFKIAIERAEALNIKAIFARYLYQVELDEKTGAIKQILIEHLRERLVRNDGSFEWVAPIHETLMEKVPVGKTDFQDFMVVHLTNQDEMESSMWRNIEILEEEVMKADEIKVIVPGLGSDESLSQLKGAHLLAMRDTFRWPTLSDALRWAQLGKTVFLQPRNAKFDIDHNRLRIVQDLLLDHPNLRLSVQMHKILRVQ